MKFVHPWAAVFNNWTTSSEQTALDWLWFYSLGSCITSNRSRKMTYDVWCDLFNVFPDKSYFKLTIYTYIGFLVPSTFKYTCVVSALNLRVWNGLLAGLVMLGSWTIPCHFRVLLKQFYNILSLCIVCALDVVCRDFYKQSMVQSEVRKTLCSSYLVYLWWQFYSQCFLLNETCQVGTL